MLYFTTPVSFCQEEMGVLRKVFGGYPSQNGLWNEFHRPFSSSYVRRTQPRRNSPPSPASGADSRHRRGGATALFESGIPGKGPPQRSTTMDICTHACKDVTAAADKKMAEGL